MGGEAHRYYLRRDGMQSISTEGGVGGRVLLTREGRERERERERELGRGAGPRRFFMFWSCEFRYNEHTLECHVTRFTSHSTAQLQRWIIFDLS